MALDKLPISIKKKKSLVAHHFLTPERNRRKKGEVVGRGGRVVGAGGRGGGQRGGRGGAAAGTEEVDRVSHI